MSDKVGADYHTPMHPVTSTGMYHRGSGFGNCCLDENCAAQATLVQRCKSVRRGGEARDSCVGSADRKGLTLHSEPDKELTGLSAQSLSVCQGRQGGSWPLVVSFNGPPVLTKKKRNPISVAASGSTDPATIPICSPSKMSRKAKRMK